MIIVLTIITMFPRAYGWIIPQKPLIVSVEELNQGVEAIEEKSFRKEASNKRKSRYHVPKQKFNPNDYQLADWVKLGLSEKQANVILKFSKRSIKNNEQLQQIFVIDDELFQLIKDSTFYPQQKEWISERKSEDKKEPIVLDLNFATIEELEKLPGIGDFYAKQIVEYREKLGGYISKKQLLELWKFDEEKLNKINLQLLLNASNVKQLNINICTAEELAKHPYIKWKIANSIVKMRSKHQKYSHFEQLLESELIDKEWLEKVKPYLTLN